ncbi:polycystin-1-like protein 2 [Mytilus edulis]|uniref:polycystin-1-like protein 2 n=1 Tax=Mytilus edulis TaxID=6550 RepID=UPI0039F1371C
MTIFQVRPLVSDTESSLLKMMILLIERQNIDLIEISGDLTISGYRMLVRDIFFQPSIFNVLRIPPTPENLAANSSYADKTVIFLMIVVDQSLFTFVPDPYGLNSGIFKTFLMDADGQPVEIFNSIDFLFASNEIQDGTNVGNPSTNGTENLEASFDFGSENGMVSVLLSSLQECTTTVSSTNSTFDIVTIGLNTVIKDESPSNINISFYDQSLQFFARPPNPPMDMFVHCKACIQQSEVIFVLDASGSVTAPSFGEMKDFVVALVQLMQIGPEQVRIGLLVFSTTPSVIFHLNEFTDSATIITNILGANYTGGSTYTGAAFREVRTAMLPLARPGVQRLVIYLADGASSDTILLYDESDMLKASGVEIVGVGIRSYDYQEFQTVTSDPDAVYFFPVPDFSALTDLSTNMIKQMCGGLWTNLTSNEIRAGKLSMYALNSADNKWERSSDIKLKAIEDSTVVFESNFFGTFGVKIMAISPETIDFDEVFTNFDDKIADNPYVIAMNCILLAGLAIGTVIMRKLDLEDKRLWQYKPLADNIDNATFSYYISVHTGFWSNFRLSSTPYIILKGWYGETMCRPLVDKAGLFRNLMRWRCSNFLLKTDVNLGPLTEVKIWHDNAGVNKSLFLDKVLISTGKLGETYVFFCNDWLSDSKGDTKTYRQLYCAQTEFKDGNTLFTSITRFRLFDEHLLLSLFGRPSFSRFSRVQRLYCIASMMSLSFLASAMFFKADDTVHIHGVSIGPMKVTYKQVYVGLMTSVMTFPVGFLMGYIFRNRRYKQNPKDLLTGGIITKDNAKLPWFFVFIGYGIAGSTLASGSFFTTLYSIQWGSETSTDWMLSILFGTTNGIMFFDPFKVLFLSLIVALVFKGFARKEIEIMAPFYVDDSQLGIGLSSNVPFYNKWPGDNKETGAVAEMKRRLGLDQKLSKLFQGILLELLFVALLSLICSHFVITNAYLQNDQLIKQLQPLKKINVTNDIWNWMFYKYLPNIYPRKRYNDGFMSPEERKFTSDEISFRMGPIRLRQIRTNGICDIPEIMENSVHQCSPDLSFDTEEKGNFCPDWTTYNDNCFGSGFTYMSSEETGTFTKFGEYDKYGGGGYVLDLNPFKRDVKYEILKLNRTNWIDKQTRFISIENVILNVNTKLFSLVTFMVEIPTTGGYYLRSDVLTSNLYPYINAWDYVVLAGQIFFVLLTFIRTVYFTYEAWKLKSKCFRSITCWGTMLSILLSFTAVACYIARIDRTIVIVEDIFNSAGTFVSFELVQLMDDINKACIGVVLFIAILNLLSSLSFNYYLYMMKTSIGLAKVDILSFALLAAIILAAFSSFTYIVMGGTSYQFRDFFNTFGTLFRMMLAMVTFRDAEMTANAQSNVIFSFFIFIMTLLMVNVFICILNDAFATVKSSWNTNKDIEPFDEELNEHFWWKVGQAFTVCASSSDAASKYKPEPSGVDQDFKQLDEMIGRLFKRTTNTFEGRYSH